MHQVLIAGVGKIGSAVASMLSETKDYDVHVLDVTFESREAKALLLRAKNIKTVSLSLDDPDSIVTYLKQHQIQAVISCLPYFLTVKLAVVAKNAACHYFDLTEDLEVTQKIKTIAQGAPKGFVPQCGLAPGMTGLIAHDLIQAFDVCESAIIRVGALPRRTINPLHYALTWSVDGLVNEYLNPCSVLLDGQLKWVCPLEGLEEIEIEGRAYEAFYTSGGLGSLVEIYAGKIQQMNYKSIRYPGHCEKMDFLLNQLKLKDDRKTLIHILERVLPRTLDDMIIIYISVTGQTQGETLEKSYLKQIFPETIGGVDLSAIQVSTASGLCAIVDEVMGNPNEYHGLVLQEIFSLNRVLKNRFAAPYR